MKNKYLGIATALLISVGQSAYAIEIMFEYSEDENSNSFFGTNVDPNRERRDVLMNAGKFWGSRLKDTLDSQGTPYISVPQDTLKIFIGAKDLGVNSSGGSIFGEASPSFITSLHRGETGAFDNPPTDFGPWGGTLNIDIDTQWYVDPDTKTTESFVGTDLYSVALHEIGHILGIGTAQRDDILLSWGVNVGEVPTGPQAGTKVFTGENAFNLAVENDDFFIELEDDAIHFAQEGTNGFGGGLEGQESALMVPFIGEGIRRLPTNLEYAALEDIGWEVAAVPVPAAAWLFGTGLLGLLGFKKYHST